MAKILVAYYSRTGNTATMAEIVGRAAASVEGAEVTVRSIEEMTADDLLGYEGIILGSPVYFGLPAAELKQLVDESNKLHGQLAGKVGGAFTSFAGTGGNETALMAMLQMLLIHGMIVQGEASGDHYGPVAVGAPDARSAEQCEKLGRNVAALAVRLFG